MTVCPELRKYPHKHEEFETIKQEDSADCGAAVVAMVAGLSLKEAKAGMTATKMIVKEDEHLYYKTRELARYLACHGILMGLYARVLDGHKRLPKVIDLRWKMEDFPAILAVKSERFADQDHFVLWDGRKVRDPNPKHPELRELSELHVLEIIPLVHCNEDDQHIPSTRGLEG